MNTLPTPLADFDVEIDRLWTQAKLVPTQNKINCHYMPQFLQRRWAENGMLRVMDIRL